MEPKGWDGGKRNLRESTRWLNQQLLEHLADKAAQGVPDCSGYYLTYKKESQEEHKVVEPATSAALGIQGSTEASRVISQFKTSL